MRASFPGRRFAPLLLACVALVGCDSSAVATVAPATTPKPPATPPVPETPPDPDPVHLGARFVGPDQIVVGGLTRFATDLVLPSDRPPTEKERLQWVSSDPRVASVRASLGAGVEIVGTGPGEVLISAYRFKSDTLQFRVTVHPRPEATPLEEAAIVVKGFRVMRASWLEDGNLPGGMNYIPLADVEVRAPGAVTVLAEGLEIPGVFPMLYCSVTRRLDDSGPLFSGNEMFGWDLIYGGSSLSVPAGPPVLRLLVAVGGKTQLLEVVGDNVPYDETARPVAHTLGVNWTDWSCPGFPE